MPAILKYSEAPAHSPLTGGEKTLVLTEAGATAAVTIDQIKQHVTDGKFVISTFLSGTPEDAQTLLYLQLPLAIRIPANFAGSKTRGKTAATGSTVYTIKKIDALDAEVTVGTFTVSAAGKSGTPSVQAAVDFELGDILVVQGPTVADATLDNFGIQLLVEAI